MAFPTTSIIDDFNRGDNATAIGGTGWSSPFESGDNSFGINTNQCYVSVGWCNNYRTTPLAADQEVYLDVPTLPNVSFQLWARLQGTFPAASYSGYRAVLWSDGTITLYSVVNGTPTDIGYDGTGISAGDSIGIECIGTAITVYKKTGGSWSVAISATNGDVTGAGNIGIKTPGTETTVRLDNFGGGEIVTTPSLSTEGPYGTLTLDDFNRADGDLGANWSIIHAGVSDFKIVSNTAIITTGSSGTDAWIGSTFGQNVEVHTTLAAVSVGGRIYARINQLNSTTYTGYRLSVSETTFALDRLDSGSGTIQQLDTYSGSHSSGDRIALTCIGNVIKAWYRTAGEAWVNIISVVDATYVSEGYIGIGTLSDATVAFDDFGGGTINAILMPSYPMHILGRTRGG